MTEYVMLNDFKCKICKKRFKMEYGHPIYAGIYDEQYCLECILKYQKNGTMPSEVKDDR